MDDNALIIIGGAILLIAGAFSPEGNRAKVRSIFGSIFGDGHGSPKPATQPSPDSGNQGQSLDPRAEGGDKIDVLKLPRDRTLTQAEVYALASYMVDRFNIDMPPKHLVAVAWIESSFRPWVDRDEGFDKSTGLMQTLLGTAKDLYKKGYNNAPAPTHENLKDPYVSMYYGASYFDWVKSNWRGKSIEWYIRAYNGGPGWEKTKNGPVNTQHYYNKWADKVSRGSVSIKFGGT